jgi:hypothetical protein
MGSEASHTRYVVQAKEGWYIAGNTEKTLASLGRARQWSTKAEADAWAKPYGGEYRVLEITVHIKVA